MKITATCQAYFNGIPEIINFRNNDIKTNLVSSLKVLSLITGVIPLFFAITYGIASLVDRVSHKKGGSEDDQKVAQVFSRSVFNGTVYLMVNGKNIPYSDEAAQISIYEFHQMDDQKKKEAIEKFELGTNIELIGGNEALSQTLNLSNQEILKSVTLHDLQLNSSRLKYALLSDQEFMALTLIQLKPLQSGQVEIISTRLKNLEGSAQINATLPENILDLKIVEFPFVIFSHEQIIPLIEELELSIVSLLSEMQSNYLIANLDIEKLTEPLYAKLFIYNSSEENKRRFAMLPNDQARAAIKKFGSSAIDIISEAQLTHYLTNLDIATLSYSSYSKLKKLVLLLINSKEVL